MNLNIFDMDSSICASKCDQNGYFSMCFAVFFFCFFLFCTSAFSLSPKFQLSQESRTGYERVSKEEFVKSRDLEGYLISGDKTIPFHSATDHHKILKWIKSLIKNGLLTSKASLMNIDNHGDTANKSPLLSIGNWVSRLRDLNILRGPFYWFRRVDSLIFNNDEKVYKEKIFQITEIMDFSKIFINEQGIPQELVVTLDYDFIAPYPEERYSSRIGGYFRL